MRSGEVQLNQMFRDQEKRLRPSTHAFHTLVRQMLLMKTTIADIFRKLSFSKILFWRMFLFVQEYVNRTLLLEVKSEKTANFLHNLKGMKRNLHIMKIINVRNFAKIESISKQKIQSPSITIKGSPELRDPNFRVTTSPCEDASNARVLADLGWWRKCDDSFIKERLRRQKIRHLNKIVD